MARKRKSEKSKPQELSPGNEGGKGKQLGVMETACLLRYSYSLLSESFPLHLHSKGSTRGEVLGSFQTLHPTSHTCWQRLTQRRFTGEGGSQLKMSPCKPRGLPAFHINPLVLKKRSILPCTCTCFSAHCLRKRCPWELSDGPSTARV